MPASRETKSIIQQSSTRRRLFRHTHYRFILRVLCIYIWGISRQIDQIETGGVPNLERRNVERPIFRNFKITNIKGSFSCKRSFSLLNFERGLKKNYGLPNLEILCSYYSLLETATVLILCKNIESFLRYDCSKWDMLFSQR